MRGDTADWLVLAVFVVLVAAAAALVWRRPTLAVYAFVIGLAVHNTVFVLLDRAGADGWQLTVAQAWKEILLAAGIASVAAHAFRRRALPFDLGVVELAALAFAAIVVLYALLPQARLGGEATPEARLYALRHYLLPIAAFFLGRSLALTRGELRRILSVVLAVGVGVAAVGIAADYLISVKDWIALGVGSFYSTQLDLRYAGPAGVPENFVLTTADGLYRRLVSVFLSPLASAYLFVVVLTLAAAGAYRFVRRELLVVALALVGVGLLLTYTRSALLALAVGLVALAGAVRRIAPLLLAPLVVLVGVLGLAFITQIAPAERSVSGFGPPGEAPEKSPLEETFRLEDASSRTHLRAVDEGARTLADHPLGYGLGNSGIAAARTGVDPRAQESGYFELGADAGVFALVAWIAFLLALLARLLRHADGASRFERDVAAGTAAALVALSATALISDVWGVPWIAYVVPCLVGSLATARELASEPERAYVPTRTLHA